jgi:CRP-like cAMP-binding protein
MALQTSSTQHLLFNNPFLLSLCMFENYMLDFGIFTEDEIAYALSNAELIDLEKYDYLIQQGEECRDVAFVCSGTLRSFYISQKDEEITYCISFPGSFITAYSSFITGKKTTENIQALEKVQLIVLKRSFINGLAEKSTNWLKFLKMMAENQYVELEERIFQLQKFDATHRYTILIEKSPQFIRSIPLRFLASYLGVTPRHLSRIRSRVFRQMS